MTVLGAFLPDQDSVVAWADSQTFSDCGEPGRHVQKLIVNPTAQMLGAGAGIGLLARTGDALVRGAGCLDDAARQMPAALRAKAGRAVRGRREPYLFGTSCYVLAGWSHRSQRTLIYQFDAASFFTARLAAETTSPTVEYGAKPQTETQVRDLARRQMSLVCENYPLAGAGSLTIATLCSTGISVHVHRDFAELRQAGCPQPYEVGV